MPFALGRVRARPGTLKGSYACKTGPSDLDTRSLRPPDPLGASTPGLTFYGSSST